MRYRVSMISILMFFSLAVVAQEETLARIWASVDSLENAHSTEMPAMVNQPSRWNYQTTVGAGMMVGSPLGPLMNTYLAPNLSYQLSPRLSLHGGTMLTHFYTPSMLQGEQSVGSSAFSSVAVFGAASYRLTDQLIVHGAGVRQMAAFPSNGIAPAMEFTDLSVGATYNFGSFSIGASFHRSSRPNTFSPFGGGFYPSAVPAIW